MPVNLFECISMARKMYGRMVAPVCEKHGLTRMEFNVLLFLANNPECDTAAQIVDRRGLSKSHVSISVRALRERGLLTCTQEGEDRRVVHLAVHESAAEIVADGQEAQRQFAAALLEGFSEEEKALLYAYARRIDGNISHLQQNDRS